MTYDTTSQHCDVPRNFGHVAPQLTLYSDDPTPSHHCSRLPFSLDLNLYTRFLLYESSAMSTTQTSTMLFLISLDNPYRRAKEAARRRWIPLEKIEEESATESSRAPARLRYDANITVRRKRTVRTSSSSVSDGAEPPSSGAEPPSALGSLALEPPSSGGAESPSTVGSPVPEPPSSGAEPPSGFCSPAPEPPSCGDEPPSAFGSLAPEPPSSGAEPPSAVGSPAPEPLSAVDSPAPEAPCPWSAAIRAIWSFFGGSIFTTCCNVGQVSTSSGCFPNSYAGGSLQFCSAHSHIE